MAGANLTGESLREGRCDLGSQGASGSGAGHLVVRRILQDVVELGWLPKELNNPKTATRVAERRLAQQVRKRQLRERAQQRRLQTPRPCCRYCGSISVVQ